MIVCCEKYIIIILGKKHYHHIVHTYVPTFTQLIQKHEAHQEFVSKGRIDREDDSKSYVSAMSSYPSLIMAIFF